MAIFWEDASGILAVNTAISAAAFLVTWSIIPKLRQMFLNAGFSGIDMNKKGKEKM